MSFAAKLNTLWQKKSLWDVAFLYGSSVVNGGALFFINAILGRSLTKDWYATFSLSLLVLSTVAEISDLGLNGALARFAPYYIVRQEIDKLKQLVKTIWRWRVSMTVVLTFGGLALSYPLARFIFKQPHIAPYLAASFLGVGGVILLGFVNTYLQAQQRFRYNAFLQTLKGALRFGGVGIMALAGVENIFYYLAVYILVPWGLFLAAAHVLPNGFRTVKVTDEVKQGLHSQLARFSLWLSLWSVFSIVAARIDQVMVSRFLGLEEVAVYAVAYQLIQLYPLVAQSITAVLNPKISALHHKDELVAFVIRSLKWLVWPILGIGLLVYPSQYIITWFFGAGYAAALPIYLVLAFSLVANLVVIPFSLVITVYNRTDLMAFSGVIQFLVSIFGTLFFIPRFGVVGAAYTFSLGIAVAVVYNMACAVWMLKYRQPNVS